jgi:putative holliday junction resolvase
MPRRDGCNLWFSQMRYLAIDYGAKTTGLAICDPTETIVSPLASLATAKNLVGKILEFVQSEGIEAIVLGLPLNMDGSSGGQAEIIRAFAEKLKEHISIPIFLQDERLTTFAAEGKLVERELTRKKKRARIDALAAAEILQAFLDSKQSK